MNHQNKRTPDQYLTAFRADPSNAPLALYAGAALQDADRHEEALAVWTFGDDANPALRKVRLHPQANAEIREFSTRADTAIRNHFNDLHRKTINDYAKSLDHDDLDRVRKGVWVHYHDGPVNYLTEKQQPPIFYMPDLPAAPIASNKLLPWVKDIEASYTDILEEYNSTFADADIEP